VNVRTTLFRRIRLIAIILLAIVLVPYGFSRVASSWRRLSVHTSRDLPAGKRDNGTFRIACYNIAHGRGLATSNWRGGTAEERNTRLRQIADLLRHIDADIVVLNEVDFDSSWSSSTNQARYLAKQAGYPYWAEQRNLDFRVLTWKWRFGNAVLSRYPIVQASVVDLPGFSAVETFFAGKKRILNCTIELNGDKVRVLAVHLCLRKSHPPIPGPQLSRAISTLARQDSQIQNQTQLGVTRWIYLTRLPCFSVSQNSLSARLQN